KFLTTELGNNSAARYAIGFTNPGFTSDTVLTFSMDVWDPAVNPRSSANTFPRAVAGIVALQAPNGMPPYFGIEHVDQGQNDKAEWVVAGEDFTGAQFGPADSVQQDAWYTVRSVWNLGTGRESVSYKLRGTNNPFTTVFANVPIGFTSPAP